MSLVFAGKSSFFGAGLKTCNLKKGAKNSQFVGVMSSFFVQVKVPVFGARGRRVCVRWILQVICMPDQFSLEYFN